MGLHPVLAVIIGILAALGLILLVATAFAYLGDCAWILGFVPVLAAGGALGWGLLARD